MALQKALSNSRAASSEHRCRRSLAYADNLSSAYRALREAFRPFSVVYISQDSDEASFAAFTAARPWLLAVPFTGTEARRASLFRRFQVADIPAVVLLRADGSVISRGSSPLTIEPVSPKLLCRVRGACRPGQAAAPRSNATAAFPRRRRPRRCAQA